jgi:uncharacterized protein YqgC (DUF456 family)
MSPTLITFLVALAMLTGIVGSLIPVLPDVILIWGAGLVYGLAVGWGSWGPWLFAGMTILGGLALLTEVWMSGAGARAGGASIWGILAGFALGAVGLVFFSPIGGFVGLLLGTFLVEYLRLGDRHLALKAVFGAGVGFGTSFLVKLGLCLGMAGLWVVWVLTM